MLDQHRHEAAAQVVPAAVVLRVGGHRIDERAGGEDVVAHRRQDLVRRIRQPNGFPRLLAEGADAVIVAGFDDAK